MLSQELESKLRCQHQDDLATQLQANKLALEAVKSQLEQKHLTESDELKKRFENDQGMHTQYCKQYCNIHNTTIIFIHVTPILYNPGPG